MLGISAVNKMYPDQQYLNFRVFLQGINHVSRAQNYSFFSASIWGWKKRPVDPQNPENVTLCSLDPVVSHILTVIGHDVLIDTSQQASKKLSV
jgi:hypothetical protein